MGDKKSNITLKKAISKFMEIAFFILRNDNTVTSKSDIPDSPRSDTNGTLINLIYS